MIFNKLALYISRASSFLYWYFGGILERATGDFFKCYKALNCCLTEIIDGLHRDTEVLHCSLELPEEVALRITFKTMLISKR